MITASPNLRKSGSLTKITPITIFASTALLLAFVATRLHSLLALPMFLDEGIHLTWARHASQGSPLEALLSAKQLLIFSIALFNLSANTLFLGRFVVILLGLVGIASVTGLGRLLYSRTSGLIAGTLWLFCPFMFFFERLVLADPTLAAAVTFAAWALVRLTKTGTTSAAVVAGVALALCPLAKVTGVIFVVLPLLSLFLTSRHSNRKRIKTLLITYMVFVILVGIPALIVQQAAVVNKEIVPIFGNPITTTSLLINSTLVIDAYFRYFSVPFLIELGSTVLFGWRYGWRQRLMPALILALPVLVLVSVSRVLYIRYMLIAVPGLLLLSAMGMADLIRILRFRPRYRSSWSPAVFVAISIGLWSVLIAGPFFFTAYHNPAALSLSYGDTGEYLQSWSSGYGIREATADLLDRAKKYEQPLVVVGMVGNCQAAALSIPSNSSLTLLCPDVNDTNPESNAETHLFIRDQLVKQGSVLVLAEEHGPNYISYLPASSQLLATFPRPGGTAPVELLRVSAFWPTF